MPREMPHRYFNGTFTVRSMSWQMIQRLSLIFSKKKLWIEVLVCSNIKDQIVGIL